MRMHIVAIAFALLSANLIARADTVTASAVPSFTIVPSADTLSFSSVTTNVSVPGSFMQPGGFTGGDSGFLVQTVPFTFPDTVTVNGLTKVLTFTGTDDVSPSVNLLQINRLGPVNFGDVALTFSPATASVTVLGETAPLNLTGTLVFTPEPASFVLVGGILLVILLNKHSTRRRARHHRYYATRS